MRRFWIRALVDIAHYHDRNDHILLFHDEEDAWDGLLDGLLHKRQA